MKNLILPLAIVCLSSCSSIPTKPGVPAEDIKRGIVGTWISHGETSGSRTRLKKCFRPDGTAESWLTGTIKRSGSYSETMPPMHLTSRWRVEGDTLIAWDFKRDGKPLPPEIVRDGTLRDKIVVMEPNHFRFYSYDWASQRPTDCYRTNESMATF